MTALTSAITAVAIIDSEDAVIRNVSPALYYVAAWVVQYDSRKYGMKGSELGRKLAEAVPTAAGDIQALTDTKTDIPVLASGLAEVSGKQPG